MDTKSPTILRSELLTILDSNFYNDVKVDVRDKRLHPDMEEDKLHRMKAKFHKTKVRDQYIIDNEDSFIICCESIFKEDVFKWIRRYVQAFWASFNSSSFEILDRQHPFLLGREKIPPIELVYSYFLSRIYLLRINGPFLESQINPFLISLRLAEDIYKSSRDRSNTDQTDNLNL